MGISVQAIVILIVYAFGINIMLLELSRIGVGIQCPTLSAAYNTTNSSLSFSSITDLALGRCEGLPLYLVLLFELPVIAGLLYIARAFVGAT